MIHPLGHPDEFRPVLLADEMRELRLLPVDQHRQRHHRLVRCAVGQRDLAAEIHQAVGLHAARGHRGRIGGGVLAVQRDHRDALAAIELIGDEAPETKAGLARLVDQEAVVDAHQLDKVVREQHELRSRAPRVVALARRREAHGAVPLGQCIEVVRDDKRMLKTKRAVWHGGIPIPARRSLPSSPVPRTPPPAAALPRSRRTRRAAAALHPCR